MDLSSDAKEAIGALHFEEIVIYLILLIGLMILQSQLRRRGFEFFGIGFHRKDFSDFVHGTLIAIVYIVSYLALMFICGREHLTFDTRLSLIVATIGSATKISVIMLPEILFTEMLFRGCLFATLLRKKHDLFTSLIVTSAAFAAFSVYSHRGLPFLPVYAANTFMLSLIMCIMVYVDQSLMGALGKTIAFEVIQSLLFANDYTANLSCFLSPVLEENIFTGSSGIIDTSLGFSIILVLSLSNEIHHLHEHQLSHNSNYMRMSRPSLDFKKGK